MAGHPTYVLRALELFAEYGDLEAIVDDKQRLTYADVRAEVLELAATLRSHGVRAGMSVAVLIGHPVEGPILQLALHLLGCRVVWIMRGTAGREMDEYLRLTKPDVFLYDARDQGELADERLAALGSIPVLCLGPGGRGPDLLAAGTDPGVAIELAAVADGEPESVFQTSGTTGVPKPILHGNTCFRQVVRLGEDWLAAGHPRQRHLSTTPLWWAAGTVAAMITLCSGGVLVMLGRYEPPEFLEVLERERINYAFLPPAVFYLILDLPELDRTDCSSLYMLNLGGAPLSPGRLRQGIERFGPTLRIAYGLSEAPYISALPGVTEERLGSCGTPWGDVRIEIRDEHGRVLEPGEVGEVWVSTALTFVEYIGHPELTAETLVDGWLCTRDLGYLDAEGYLYLVGRSHDMIITGYGARKIYARPIEDILAEHPKVRAAAVIGVPDPELVQVVHAYVVPDPAGSPTIDELRARVTDQLPEIWAPRTIDFVDSLPLIGFGKVDKKTLRARYAAEHDPYRLCAGEAEELLAGHPWRRFVVVGDSVAEGVVEPVDGYPQLAWADQVAAGLAAVSPDLVYRNLGRRDLRARQVLQTQLADAVAFDPDLALVTCGAIDALRATYDPDAVDGELTAMITALQATGADVITLGVFDISHSPALEEWARPGVRKRYATLVDHIAKLSAELGTIHIDLFNHPANDDPSTYSSDGRHGNARSHTIAAAEAIRRLGKEVRSRVHNGGV